MSVVKNRAINPSNETNTTGMTAVPGTSGAIAAGCVSTVATTAFGVKVSRTTWTTASTAAGGGQYLEVDVATAGLVVGDTISAGIFHVLAHIITRLQFSVEFRTGVGTISTSTAAAQLVTAVDTIYGTAAAPDATMKLEGLVIPATCTKIRLRVLSIAGTSYANWSIGSYLDLDGLMVEKHSTLRPYVDGDQGNAYGWEGTAHASIADFMTPATTLDPLEDPTPSPRVQISVVDLYPSTRAVTLYRVVDGISYTVREAILLAATGSFVANDYEAPFGVDVTYQAMQFSDLDGLIPLGLTPIATTLLDVVEDWITDPLRPANALRVEFTDKAGSQPSAPFPYTQHRVNTPTGLRIVALVGDRSLLTGLNMDFYTSTDDERAQITTILEQSGGLLCLRTPPVGSMKLIPRTLYVVAGNPVPDDFNLSADLPDVEWYNTVDEISAPEIGFGVPIVTWQNYVDAFPTWNDFNAAYLTWFDAEKNPPGV